MLKMPKRAGNKAGVTWQQPMMRGAATLLQHCSDRQPLVLAAAQAFQNYSQPKLADAFKCGAPEEEEEAFLIDGSPKLTVRVKAAVDRDDFSGKSYVAFLVCCRFGGQEWTLEKRFTKFRELNEQLVVLLGRDLAARLPAMPSRIPTILGACDVHERRLKLDIYIKGLAKLAVCGPLGDGNLPQGDDDAHQNMLHVLHELYKFVEFVSHVVPGKGDRALNEDEDNSDDEHENESPFQSPALILALTQVKRVREQLADKQLACDSARQLKVHLGQQLVQKLEQVKQLEDNLAHTADEIEAVLYAHQQQQQIRKQRQQQQQHLAAHVATASPSTRPPTFSTPYLPHPLVAAATAVSSRIAARRPLATTATSPAPSFSRKLNDDKNRPQEHKPDWVGDWVGVEESGGRDMGIGWGEGEAGEGGVDSFAIALYGVRGKLQTLKEQQFSSRRSWASLWRGKV